MNLPVPLVLSIPSLFLFLTLPGAIHPLDNGLARTPPMGWLSWLRFGCETDCQKEPDNCISENLYKAMADRMVADGYKDAGYEYVNIDDCWSAKERDPQTNALVADPDRFPSGIKALADYVHSKGLKLGIYGDMGYQTCGGYPGNKFFMELDAQTFASWGVDSFKMDGCFTDVHDFDTGYPVMAKFLNMTGRPILFSCEWAAYDHDQGLKIDYQKISETCNICRNSRDISDSWLAVTRLLKEYGDDNQTFSAVQGPGFFNDPDMLIVGNPGLSVSQGRVQMAMWAMFGAPLLMSADLREISDADRKTLLNPAVIAINQDKLGIMGKRAPTLDPNAFWIQVWSKPILPSGSFAIAIVNERPYYHGDHVVFTLEKIGIKHATGNFNLTDVFTGKPMGQFNSSSVIDIKVDVMDVFLGRLTPV